MDPQTRVDKTIQGVCMTNRIESIKRWWLACVRCSRYQLTCWHLELADWALIPKHTQPQRKSGVVKPMDGRLEAQQEGREGQGCSASATHEQEHDPSTATSMLMLTPARAGRLLVEAGVLVDSGQEGEDAVRHIERLSGKDGRVDWGCGWMHAPNAVPLRLDHSHNHTRTQVATPTSSTGSTPRRTSPSSCVFSDRGRRSVNRYLSMHIGQATLSNPPRKHS